MVLQAEDAQTYKRGDVVEIRMVGIVQEAYGKDGLRITVDPKDAAQLYSDNSKKSRFWTLVPKSAARKLGR